MSPLKGNAFALTYILGLQPYRELAREGSRSGGEETGRTTTRAYQLQPYRELL